MRSIAIKKLNKVDYRTTSLEEFKTWKEFFDFHKIRYTVTLTKGEEVTYTITAYRCKRHVLDVIKFFMEQEDQYEN